MRLAPVVPKRSSDWVLQLINIVFLLLLFFLVNGTIAEQQEIGVEPPRSILITAGNPPRDAVSISREGRIVFRGAPVTADLIVSQLKSDAKAMGLEGDTLPALVIAADRRLKAARLIDTIDALKGLGVRDISLVTIQDEAR